MSKWSSSAPLPRPVTKIICSIPASRASSTAYWISGRSTTVSISFGIALVAGRKRVPSPATGKTALRTGFIRGRVAGYWRGRRIDRNVARRQVEAVVLALLGAAQQFVDAAGPGDRRRRQQFVGGQRAGSPSPGAGGMLCPGGGRSGSRRPQAPSSERQAERAPRASFPHPKHLLRRLDPLLDLRRRGAAEAGPALNRCVERKHSENTGFDPRVDLLERRPAAAPRA